MPRRTDRLWRQAGWIATIAALAAALPGCRTRGRPPPLEPFEVKLEIPLAPGAAAPVVPEGVLHPFRVWINQEIPRQKKNPEWRSFPAKEGSLLDLAPDGKWRCLVNPARVFGKFEDDKTIQQWTVSRTVRCSSDQWQTYVEGLVRVAYKPDGTKDEADPREALYLNDVVDGHPRVTAVVLDAADSKRATH